MTQTLEEVTTLSAIPTGVFMMSIKEIPVGNKLEKVIDLDNKEGSRRVHIKTHKAGLIIALVPRFDYIYKGKDNEQIIPGQYPQEDFVEYVLQRSSIFSLKDKSQIETAKAHLILQLEESGIWENRGKISWKNVPEDFWKSVNIDNFVIGTIKSFDAWWSSALLKFQNGRNLLRAAYKWENKVDVEHSIKLGQVPENINRIRHWNKLSFDELIKFMGLGYSTSPAWNAFVTNVKPVFYAEFMEKHNDWTTMDNFAMGVEYLNRIPKNERIINALNSLANSGLSIQDIVELNITTAKDMEKAANYSTAYQAIARKNKKHLNSNYKPPVFAPLVDENDKEIPNQFVFDSENYEWATHLTFPALSDLYACCISRYGLYEERIVDGIAHAMFAKDRSKENDMGVLAYISYSTGSNSYYRDASQMDNSGTWNVQEIRCYANGSSSAKHKAYAEKVAQELNRRLPGKHAQVAQMEREQLMAEMATDEIGLKVRDIWARK